MGRDETYWFKDTLERLVRYAIFERDIDGVSLANASTSIVLGPGAGKVVAIFVKAARHDAICGVESLLDPIAVMAVDVDVENAWVYTQKLQNSQHNIIDIAEPGCFSFLGMVQASCPINCNVGST